MTSSNLASAAREHAAGETPFEVDLSTVRALACVLPGAAPKAVFDAATKAGIVGAELAL
jgi:hypothetical protein